MATLVLTAVGSLVGGPLGGAIGSLIGNQIDRAVIGSGERQGQRLQDLAITTSTYGTPIPRHFGHMRAAGSIIWATDAVETEQRSGGGKGQPSTTQYSYSISFAVALASRPIAGLGRVWADGNLLRGAAGDLKVGGALRIYHGHGDQLPDPLIASDKGAACPAFRGLAYCVFEGLHLAEFGNRIPALSFEILADDGAVMLADLTGPAGLDITVERPLDGLTGYTDPGLSLADNVAAIDAAFPIGCDCSGEKLALFAADNTPAGTVPTLPHAAIDTAEGSFGAASGHTARRIDERLPTPGGIRYYDRDRDFQPGLQRADGRPRPGQEQIIEFPAAMAASTARGLANAAAMRAGAMRDSLSWRIAQLDPALRPGTVVRLPDRSGLWRILTWEWRDSGVELELRRLPMAAAGNWPADPGAVAPAPDRQVTPTLLHAFDLPAESDASPDLRQTFVAAGSATAGWKGAAFYAVLGNGALEPLGASGSARAALGHSLSTLPPSPCLLLEGSSWVDIELAGDMPGPLPATPDMLASGANRALIGAELIQFARADPLGPRQWRLSGLLRGRGGTEHFARQTTVPGAAFVLLDSRIRPLDAARLSDAASIAAIGIADADPVIAPIANARIGLTPLTPVHPQAEEIPDGSLRLSWCRRSRGSWKWLDRVEVPLNEQTEAYLIGLGDTDQPALFWNSAVPELQIDAALWGSLRAVHTGSALWVRQLGAHAASPPLHLLRIG